MLDVTLDAWRVLTSVIDAMLNTMLDPWCLVLDATLGAWRLRPRFLLGDSFCMLCLMLGAFYSMLDAIV